MAQTNVNIRMDSELKSSFERLCDEMGLTVTTAFTAFAKAAVRKNRMPFELEGDPFYSEANMSVLLRRAADMDAGKGSEHELPEVNADA